MRDETSEFLFKILFGTFIACGVLFFGPIALGVVAGIFKLLAYAYAHVYSTAAPSIPEMAGKVVIFGFKGMLGCAFAAIVLAVLSRLRWK